MPIQTYSLSARTCNNRLTRVLINDLEGLFEFKVDVPRIKVGNKQTVDVLIIEEALLFVKYLKMNVKFGFLDSVI